MRKVRDKASTRSKNRENNSPSNQYLDELEQYILINELNNTYMNPNSIIPQSDDRLLSYFLKETVLGIINPNSPSPTWGKRGEVVWLMVLGLILITGTEPYKILLRKNIGKLSISMPRLLFTAFLYFLVAALLIGMIFFEDFKVVAVPLITAGIFYILLSIATLVLGIKRYMEAKEKYDENPQNYSIHLYRGDSRIFKNKDLKKTWLVKEPRFCFFISLILTFTPMLINPWLVLMGLPLLMTSISFWFNEWYQINNVWGAQNKKVHKDQMKNNQQQNTGFNPEGFNPIS